MDGLDLLEAFAGEPGLCGIPVVVFSGRGEPRVAAEARTGEARV